MYKPEPLSCTAGEGGPSPQGWVSEGSSGEGSGGTSRMTDGTKRDDAFGLDGKAAIVTGGGAADDGIGNGRAAAVLLARAGAKVLVVDLDRQRAERTVAMIAEEGGTAAAFVA